MAAQLMTISFLYIGLKLYFNIVQFNQLKNLENYSGYIVHGSYMGKNK